MHISSSSGAGAAQSLAQLARLLSQSANAQSTASESQTTTSTASASTQFTENESFFLSALSSDTMSGLFQAQGGGQGRPSGPPPAGGGQPPSMEDIDSDGDGSLTQAEMESWETATHGSSDTSRASELFGKMDTDGDGSVTSEEKTAFDDQMKARGPGRGGPPPGEAQQTGQASEGTSSETLAALIQQLTAALEKYGATDTATQTQSAAVSLAA